MKMKKLLKRLKSWWFKRQFRKQKPEIAARREFLKTAIKQGKRND